jgi:type IV pilus assembly protein PilX
VALIMLLIISLLAVSGMSDTALQERMVGSMRDRDIAFEAAEAALRTGEQWVEFNPAGAAAAGELRPQDAMVWDGSSPSATGSVTGLYASDAGVSLAGAPVFHVGAPQLLRANPGETPARFESVYPVTAQALGATDETVVILRSTYKALRED